MDSQAVHSEAVETPARKMRTFLAELMANVGEASERPAICQWIRETRERLKKQWKTEHGESGNPFTQEQVAHRVGVTLGAYGAWERRLEPDNARLRQIAVALYLDQDYFLPTGDLASATARVEAEADRLHSVTEQVAEFLELLRSQLVEGADDPPRGAHGG